MRQDQPPDADADPIPELPDDLTAFSQRLASFKAQPFAVDRDRLMFEAGQVAGRNELHAAATTSRRKLRLWQSAAMTLAAVSAGLGATMALKPEPDARVVFVERDRPRIQVDNVPARATDNSANNGTKQATAMVRKTPNSENHAPTEEIPRSLNNVSNEFAGLHVGTLSIAQFFGSNFETDRSLANTDESATFAHPNQHEPILSPRSLMMGDESRVWINRLIEEPKL